MQQTDRLSYLCTQNAITMNKSKTILLIILLLCFILCSCIQHNQRNAIKEIIELPEEEAGYALKRLDILDKGRFSEEEAAMYAAAILLTQDKMGCKTYDDSLAKVAYGYYKDYPKDSIYHIAMYFMGRCYMNSDSAEKAKYCFRKAVVASRLCSDTLFQCKSLYALSIADMDSNPRFSLRCAENAQGIYDSFSKAKETEKIRYQLNVADHHLSSKALRQADSTIDIVIGKALATHDRALITDAYLLKSKIESGKGEARRALDYAEKACSNAPASNSEALLNLAQCLKDNGRYDECCKLLDSLKLTDDNELLQSLILKFNAYLLQGKDATTIQTAADSIFRKMEQIRKSEVSKKDRYYIESMENANHMALSQIKEYRYRTTAILLIALAIILSVCAAFLYVNHSNKMKAKIESVERAAAQDRAISLKEKELAVILHQKEMQQQQITCDLMKSFISKRIDILDKLKSLDNKAPHMVLDGNDWAEIEEFLNITSNGFVAKIRESYPSLEEKDIQLMMLVKINLPAKSMANIYGISEKSVKQKLYVFKKKVGIDKENASLRDFILNF